MARFYASDTGGYGHKAVQAEGLRTPLNPSSILAILFHELLNGNGHLPEHGIAFHLLLPSACAQTK